MKITEVHVHLLPRLKISHVLYEVIVQWHDDQRRQEPKLLRLAINLFSFGPFANDSSDMAAAVSAALKTV
jgi:hypothetical protein